MIAAPWNVILTLVFIMTAVICLSGLIERSREGRRGARLTDSDVIDITHGVMSVAMIVMTWWTVWDAVTWAQVAIFAILALALVPSFRGVKGAQTVDLVGHIVLDAAMVWMLAAMPLLMAGMDMSGDAGGGHAGHGGGGGPTIESTPVWVDIVNAVFIALCVAATVWWIWRLFRSSHHRIHSLCHIAMAAGMGWMLVLMNG
ncbi:DUF5134 domain-containing protein [Microbacterium sp. LMC-P-041]|uniref:DUF5134 domain-containing protein n=1 Tax=Microbacterium sp. LMC-P-041 TaxID=3040293 RepID=UPI0025562BE3|nr:DUF5134 domain-containing protein [Microbacterium sp. LMC-P-041]